MAPQDSHTSISALLEALGRTGQRLLQLDSCEGAGGNLSIFFRPGEALEKYFPLQQRVTLPIAAPELVGGACLVSGSGQRLRDIAGDPYGTLGVISINGGGVATLHTAEKCRFRRVTSEFNSHLGVHRSRIARTGGSYNAVVHCQPRNIVYLSHIPVYQDETYLNRRLLRWQPEMIMQFPKGISILPFLPPSSTALMQASVAALEDRPLTIWSRHGVLARHDDSIEHAVDLIEYVETAAHYEYMNMLAGGPANGLSTEELRDICKTYGIGSDLVQ